MKPRTVATLSVMSALVSSFAQAETIKNGGELLKGLIDSCDIVGIATKNQNARFALRKLSPSDVVSVKEGSILIRNLAEGEKSFLRPKFITLTLSRIDRDALGAIERYYISGTFTNAPTDSSFLLLGTLGEIAFSPSDTMDIDYVRNTYAFRGVQSYTAVDLKDADSTVIASTDAWDLAIPATFNKEALCASRNTGRDTIFIP